MIKKNPKILLKLLNFLQQRKHLVRVFRVKKINVSFFIYHIIFVIFESQAPLPIIIEQPEYVNH